MHIAIGCSYLCNDKGGTQRAAVCLANAMIQRGHDVTLFYDGLKNKLHEPAYAVNPGCTVRPGPSQRHADIQAMRETLRAIGVDVFMSMESNYRHLLWAISVMGTGIPFICSERNLPAITEAERWNRLGRLAVISGADFIHELVPEYALSVPEYWRDRVRVIANSAPAALLPRADAAGAAGVRRHILYLARFAPQKAPDLLIQAFALLAHTFPDWDVHIWGHGQLEKNLRALVRELRLENRIFFKGEALDAYSCYTAAQIYCLPSRYEGLPNTLLEAMSAGLPCVAFRSCAGARTLIEDRGNGLLAPECSAASLSSCLKELMASAQLRVQLGEEAARGMALYAPETIFAQWDKLFQDAAACKGHTVMDTFREEPFASMARLSAAARREWLWRDFGKLMPGSLRWYAHKFLGLLKVRFKKG